MDKVRVRFAPSPTGFLHVGGARTALYNWLFARRHGGVFILRIEDTDVDRSHAELVTAIIGSLKWLGLDWDEGPFFQSERLERYRAAAQVLEKLGHAYPCFCTPDELEARRARAEAGHRPWKYDGRCRRLPEDDRRRLRIQGQRAALRFKVPEGGSTTFEDLVFGKIELAHHELEDFVLLRSDGNPTYHLGVVVDDLDMQVTHVLRGADHLSNTPKQILLYQALGAPVPLFAHLPLILGPDRQRLSKRHGATAVDAYREQGVLPEALLNFLALLGWTPPDQKEILSIDAMVRAFALEDVSKSNAVFDFEKLAWMNAEYLRNLPPARLFALVKEELNAAGLWQPAFEAEDRARYERAVLLLQARARNLKDFAGTGRAFFSDDFPYDPPAVQKFWRDRALAGLMDELAARLSQANPFNAAMAEQCLRALADEKQVKAGLLINACRVALTGQGVAPSLFEVMEVLGKERVVNRLRRAREHLSIARAGP
jgi:glutamyl-tRNA synthetase